MQPTPKRPASADEAVWPSFRTGIEASAGLAAGGFVFGLLFGVLAMARGFGAANTLLMSATVFAGAAQVAVLEIWNEPLPYLAIAITTALVCSRHVLMGITLYDTLSRNRRLPPFATLFLMTDANWVLTVRDQRAPNRVAFFAGSGAMMYVAWMLGTAAGVLLPGLLDPATISGLKLGGPLFIAILLCIFYQVGSKVRLVAPAVSAVVAVVASHWIGAAGALMTGVAAAAAVTLVREYWRRA